MVLYTQVRSNFKHIVRDVVSLIRRMSNDNFIKECLRTPFVLDISWRTFAPDSQQQRRKTVRRKKDEHRMNFGADVRSLKCIGEIREAARHYSSIPGALFTPAPKTTSNAPLDGTLDPLVLDFSGDFPFSQLLRAGASAGPNR
jgi:hypothetical protein